MVLIPTLKQVQAIRSERPWMSLTRIFVDRLGMGSAFPRVSEEAGQSEGPRKPQAVWSVRERAVAARMANRRVRRP